MNKTVNGIYDSRTQAKNVWEDLIATGIPRDNIFIDEAAQQVRVMVPEEAEPEVREIFSRHKLH